MKILLFPFLLISIILTAQKKERKLILLKTDTTKILKLNDPKEIQEKMSTDRKEQYKMLTVTPKDTAAYMALKEPKKDYSKYKILNPDIPEKIADTKKAQPSK
ncbi:hypothetical protein [Chryseobacterium lathyri]|jgi:hypothetical protein|uniref:Uncharacterized protein n=1 Tax=Chryseobacterium lathyri TaxID=395933 RepID=A0A511Y6K8_9FLAO|nr:hypothetical protein [Chryseobacterium lathyri]GEN70833.1 hypothetical protein CLA01_09050 [Chryseobacterium lathyri]